MPCGACGKRYNPNWQRAANPFASAPPKQNPRVKAVNGIIRAPVTITQPVVIPPVTETKPENKS